MAESPSTLWTKSRLVTSLEALAIIATGLAWAAWRFAPLVLNPRNTLWLMQGDWEVYFNGFHLYVNSGWTMPPGETPALLYPYGLSVFYSNSILWLCLVGRLVAPLVDGEFQLYGPWIALCFIGQGFATRWALTQAGLGGLPRLGASLLMVLDPAMMARSGHIPMMTHALFIVQVGLALRLLRHQDVVRTAWWSVGVTLFAIGVDGYLGAQNLPMTVGVLMMAAHRLRSRLVLGPTAGLLVGVPLMLWVVGAFLKGDVDRTAEGFGQFSSDVLSLIDPFNVSRLWKGLGAGGRQYEGFGYLGAGVLAFVPLALLGVFRRRPWAELRALLPVVGLAFGMAVYAWSSHVTVAGREVLNLEWLYVPLTPLTSLFRSSGRFIWPLHYVVALGVLVMASRFSRVPPMALGLALLAATAMQAFELGPGQHFLPEGRAPRFESWSGLGTRYRHLAIKPLQVQWVCGYDPRLVGFLTRVAAQERMSINSGNVGRAPREVKTLCNETFLGPLDLDTIYFPDANHRADPAYADARCGALDGVWACVSRERVHPKLEAALR